MYVESEHRAYVSTYPYRSTFDGRVVGTDVPLAVVTTREVSETSDLGLLTLSHERDEVLLYEPVYGSVNIRQQDLSAEETRILLTQYEYQFDEDFEDAWLITQPRLHVDRYLYEGKQEVAKFYGFEYYSNGKLQRQSMNGFGPTWKYNAHGGVTEEEHIGVTEGTEYKSRVGTLMSIRSDHERRRS